MGGAMCHSLTSAGALAVRAVHVRDGLKQLLLSHCGDAGRKVPTNEVLDLPPLSVLCGGSGTEKPLNVMNTNCLLFLRCHLDVMCHVTL
eukprot:4022492-Pleurochrysis_carterae.AAC.1